MHKDFAYYDRYMWFDLRRRTFGARIQRGDLFFGGRRPFGRAEAEKQVKFQKCSKKKNHLFRCITLMEADYCSRTNQVFFCPFFEQFRSVFFFFFPAGVCSLFGNSTLLYVSFKKKHLLKPAEYFIINLAVSDLGLTLSLYPMAITSSFYHRCYTWQRH